VHKGPASSRPRCTQSGSSVAAIPVYIHSRKKTIFVRRKWLHIAEELRENWGQLAETFSLNFKEYDVCKSRDLSMNSVHKHLGYKHILHRVRNGLHSVQQISGLIWVRTAAASSVFAEKMPCKRPLILAFYSLRVHLPSGVAFSNNLR
jgi:hypothetical protein